MISWPGNTFLITGPLWGESNNGCPLQKGVWSFDFSLVLVWTWCWTNSRTTDDLKRHDIYVTYLQLASNEMTKYSCKSLTHSRRDRKAAILKTIFFNCNFFNEFLKISIQILLNCFHKFPIDNKLALVQVMACRVFSAKPLPEPMMTQFRDAHMRHLASVS